MKRCKSHSGFSSKKVAQFGLLTALALVLSLIDRAVPLSALLSGVVPGIKLGLANTVLLYAIYVLDVPSAILLMIVKVLLSGFLFGSLSAILYSLAGGVLSLAVMLMLRNHEKIGALVISALAISGDIYLFFARHPKPGSVMFWCMILIGFGALGALAAFLVIRKHPEWRILGVSIAGAVAHNIGQVLMAVLIMKTPRLLWTYLPVLVGIGACVGCATGVVANRVLKVIRRL